MSDATKKIRVIRYHIQPEIVVDDGENLTPLPIQPFAVNAADWANFAANGLKESLAQLQKQVQAGKVTPEAPDENKEVKAAPARTAVASKKASRSR